MSENYQCDAVMDISMASVIHEQLKEFLAKGQPVVMDASAVERVDTTAVQMLAGFTRDAASAGIQVTWQNPGKALQEAGRLLGLSDQLGL